MVTHMKREDAAKQMILSDCLDIMDIFCRCDDTVRQVFMLGGLGYFALIIDGAIKWCNKANITLHSQSSELLEKLRAKVKLFSSDSAITFEEQMRLYEEIIAIEKQYYIDLQAASGKWCPKFLIPDMARFAIDNHCVGNTIQFAYELSPFNPQKEPFAVAMGRKADTLPLSYTFSYELGQSIREIIQVLSNRSYEINYKPIALAYSEKDIRVNNHRDLKSKNRARQVFNLSCRLNYILELLIPLCKPGSLLPLRLAYITYYHMERDLENLQLTKRIYYHMSHRNRNFRNAMAHYSLYGKIEDSEIREDVVGYGLFEKLLSTTYEEVCESLFPEMKRTRDTLEKYIRV